MLIGNVSISNWSVEESDHSQKTKNDFRVREAEKRENNKLCQKYKTQIHVEEESRSIQNDQINIFETFCSFFWIGKWMKTNCLYIKRNWERKNGGLKSGNKLKIFFIVRKNVEKDFILSFSVNSMDV